MTELLHECSIDVDPHCAEVDEYGMKILFCGLLALSVCAGFSPRISGQSVTIKVGPAVDDSYWPSGKRLVRGAIRTGS
jgi:hypothetical protein